MTPPDGGDLDGVFEATVDDADLMELHEEGFLRFQFPGDVIAKDPVVILEYVGDGLDEEDE